MRRDNAGENKTLEKSLQSADWKLLVKMEYTAANTPQQNALVEVKFTYLAAKARAAMHAAAVPRDRRLDFFPEVIMTMDKQDWLKLITINKVKKTRIEHYGLPLPNFTKYLRTWGEAGIIKQVKMEKLGTRESRVCLWAMPQITRATATECGIQIQRRFPRHVTWCFSTGCSSEHLQCQYIKNKVLMMKTSTVSNKTRRGVL
jgi:hypothetical protein